MNIEKKDIALVSASPIAASAALIAVVSMLGGTITPGTVGGLLLASVAMGLATLFLTEKSAKASLVGMLPSLFVAFSLVQSAS